MSLPEVPVENIGPVSSQAPEEAAPVAPEPEAVAPEPEPEPAAPTEDPIWEQRMAQFTKVNGEQQAQIQAMKSELAEFHAFKKARESNPLEAMSQVGLDPSDITNRFLGMDEHAEDPMVAMQKEVQANREELQAYKDQQQDAANERSVVKYKAQVTSMIQDSGSTYELCSTDPVEATENAYKVIQNHFERTKEASGTGEVMAMETALGHVEAFYEAQYQKLAVKRGIQAPVQDNPELQAKATQSPSTLTQQAVSQAPSSNETRYLTNEESLAKAAEKLIFT